MIAGVDTFMLLIVGLVISAGAYFMASAMDGVMGDDGFGTVPNMIILLSGGVFGFYLIERSHLLVVDTTGQAVAGITGGFAALAFLAMLKAVANRLGY
jgi:hypothetical protein